MSLEVPEGLFRFLKTLEVLGGLWGFLKVSGGLLGFLKVSGGS